MRVHLIIVACMRENKMALKDSIENNPALWMLGTLLTGFLAGISTYHWGLDFAGRMVVSQHEYVQLQDEIGPIKARENFYRTFLTYLVFKEDSRQSEQAHAKNKQAFVDLISKNYGATKSGNVSEQEAHIAIVKKGTDWISGSATLQGDPTEWPIPKEINEAVHLLNP